MSVVVCFEDGPAVGQIRDYAYLSIALPRLAWTGDHGEVQALYDRECDVPRGRPGASSSPPTETGR